MTLSLLKASQQLTHSNQRDSCKTTREPACPRLGLVHVKRMHLCTYFHSFVCTCLCAIRKLNFLCLCELPGSVFNSHIKGYSQFLSEDQATGMAAERNAKKKGRMGAAKPVSLLVWSE